VPSCVRTSVGCPPKREIHYIFSLLKFRNLEETSELKARLEVLERLLGDYVPNLPDLSQPVIPTIGQTPVHKRLRSGPTSRPLEGRANQDTANREPLAEANGVEGALAAFAGSQTLGSGSSQPTFDITSMLDQPLVFDFGTSPQLPVNHSQDQVTGPVAQTRAMSAISPRDLGHGTLVVSKSGETKYFGHTAGSEWLKDVCSSYHDIVC
jgi:hypothetical protein